VGGSRDDGAGRGSALGQPHPVLTLVSVDTASARLDRKLELLASSFAIPGRIVLDSPNARELFPPYLEATSYLTLAMVPLMEVALERARELERDDPVAEGLVAYLERHIPEELHGGSPGRGALDDLQALDIDTVAFRASVPPVRTAAYMGTLCFWIWHRHPVAILGFLALETFHPHGPTVEALIEKTGLPRAGFRQLVLHAKLDRQHASELRRVLDTLPLEPWHEDLVGLVALMTIEALVEAGLDAINAAADALPAPARNAFR
jgi:hypothetical protein